LVYDHGSSVGVLVQDIQVSTCSGHDLCRPG